MRLSTTTTICLVFLLGCTQKPSTIPTSAKAATDSTTIVPERQAAAPPYNGPRYVLMQSTIAARGTYKLDTYTGTVYQLQADRAKKTDLWVRIRRIHLLPGLDSTIDGRPNYQLFLSTIAMRFTYLININSGDTWELVEDPQTKEDYFNYVADE